MRLDGGASTVSAMLWRTAQQEDQGLTKLCVCMMLQGCLCSSASLRPWRHSAGAPTAAAAADDDDDDQSC
jgi:hypothetical protein